MDELKVKAVAILKKNAEQALKEIGVEVAFPALKLAVQKSASPVDDIVLGALEAPLKEAYLELVDQIYKEEV